MRSGGNGNSDRRPRQILAERHVPVGVVPFGDGFETEGLQPFDSCEATARGGVAVGMAQEVQDVCVLVMRQTITTSSTFKLPCIPIEVGGGGSLANP